MTRLADLRRRLARLRHRRQWVRWGTGYSGLLLALLWILAAIFLIDWLFSMDVILRAVWLALAAGAAVFAFVFLALPWLGYDESDLDMALLVERQEQIDSDLVAALEFESPEAPSWGSVALEQAVVGNVAARSRWLHVMRGLSTEQLQRRVALLGITALIWLFVGLLVPYHLSAFLNRFFLLSSCHYPTRTIIESIVVNGHEVDLSDPAARPVRVFFGQPVKFEVRCSGAPPTGPGRVDLKALQSGLRTQLGLQPIQEQPVEEQPAQEKPVEDPPTENQPTENQPRLFRAEYPRLTEAVTFTVYLGDAWIDPGRLEVTQLPIIEVELEVLPPVYAKKDAGPIRMPSGLRQISVIEGSRVLVKLVSDKLLQRATVSIEDRQHEFRQLQEESLEDRRDHWVLDDENSPLAGVLAPVRYAIQVVDVDGQQLERPIEGVIRIQADSPPRIAAATITRYVLPTAKPTIYYRAIDDYGLARIAMIREVTHPDGKTEEDEIPIYVLPAGKRPQRNVESTCAVDLSSLKLVKGDNLKVTLRAVDFRGRYEGKAALAEPLLFQVTDEQGIFASMTESDRHAAQQLRTMIQRQLGIGDSP